MDLKLDMWKAYDIVKWFNCKGWLEKLGVRLKWISQIMTCVTTASYSVLVNGSPRSYIRHTRGLQQRTLLPYLFLLYIKERVHSQIVQVFWDYAIYKSWASLISQGESSPTLPKFFLGCAPYKL